MPPTSERQVYDLVANIVHQGGDDPDEGSYKIHILHSGTGRWFELQDLHASEILHNEFTSLTKRQMIVELQQRDK